MCSKEAVVEAVEMVPGHGILYRCIHSDGSKECQYSEYENLAAVRSVKADNPKPEIRCPECKELGIVKGERDDSDRTKPDNWKYYISHPKNGLCLVTEQHRDTVLKALGRYIPKVVNQKSIQKYTHPVICPRCSKEGGANALHNNKTKKVQLLVRHSPPERVCYMVTKEHKELIANILGEKLDGIQETRPVKSSQIQKSKKAVTNFESKYEKERLKSKSLQKRLMKEKQKVEKLRTTINWAEDILARGKRV
jgi:ribosomal protein L34E